MIVQASVTVPSPRPDAGSTGFVVGHPFATFFTAGSNGWPSFTGEEKLVSGGNPESASNSRDPGEKEVTLTERQLECLGWISQGKSSTDIGAILNISGRTVDYHVGEICQRLKVRTRMQAVAYAVRRGWLSAGIPAGAQPPGGLVSVDVDSGQGRGALSSQVSPAAPAGPHGRKGASLMAHHHAERV